uniref:Cysteine rich secreted protein n=1 Tax=Riptortus pedestris TaxID=329032 RepID=R4WCU6_RIPPE|nr:cysteine rich secreted protein [Riptortus pedestris]
MKMWIILLISSLAIIISTAEEHQTQLEKTQVPCGVAYCNSGLYCCSAAKYVCCPRTYRCCKGIIGFYCCNGPFSLKGKKPVILRSTSLSKANNV